MPDIRNNNAINVKKLFTSRKSASQRCSISPKVKERVVGRDRL